MGSTHSVGVVGEDEEEDESENEDNEEEEEEGVEENDRTGNNRRLRRRRPNGIESRHLIKKVLEQEPEMLPCHASASPLSPQLSSLGGTPRLGMGPSIKVWDPYNVLAPPPPPPPAAVFAVHDDRGGCGVVEVFLVSHAECDLNLRPDSVGGRCPEAALTPNGKRQARALAVLLNSQGVRFNAVYTSPLDRARSMAVSVCQEMNFAEEQIESSDALMDMSLGHWEGCHRSEVYTLEVLGVIERLQPDFSAPSGESLREVEFRMVQFLNGTVLRLPEKLRLHFYLNHQNESQGFTNHGSHVLSNSFHDRDGPSFTPPHWDLLHRHRQGLSRKKSGKSRLQFMTTTGVQEAEDDVPSQDTSHQNTLHDIAIRSSSSSIYSCIGVFTHSVPIKCLLSGLLGCSPIMSQKFCIDDSSVTVLQHSLKSGWQIKRLNDTAHLRLL